MTAHASSSSSPRRLTCRNALLTLGIISLPFAGAALAAVPAASADSSFRAAGAPPAPAPAATVAPTDAPTETVQPLPADDEVALQAFADAGYSYADAVDLASYWGVTDPFDVKVKAGGYLAQGTALRDTPYANPAADDGLSNAYLRELFGLYGYTADDAAVLADQWGVSTRRATLKAGRELKVVGALPFVDVAVADDGPAIDAFFAAGYSYDDAVFLALAWGLDDDAYTAKVKAGQFLKTGVVLSQTPYATPEADDGLTKRQLRQVFLDFGYTVADAQVLADQWDVRVGTAKARAGSELKVVGVLPFVDLPAGDDTEVAAVEAFFAAGCSYDDALILADFWSLGEDTYSAKVKAGAALIAGEALPVTTPALGC